ncbi:hypothetical protein [Hyphomicrobium sp. CS1GBMeth3]|uniref:hypothetical protein n=1 Tax=Hyphomicrobium sp. CS1GBMeth3 TaxID=1892845 RepID=UPI00092FF028|nr:hypothetical protein [Hyphomicrobium sp. CS1GBMeth3]
MDRRDFLITGGAAAVAAATPAAAQAAEAPPPRIRPDAERLTLAMAWADAPNGPADRAHRLARRFEAMTNGRYRIEFATAEHGPESGADLLHGPVHDFVPQHPAFSYFGGLPGSAALVGQDLAHWIAIGGGQMLWDDLAASHGWKPLLAGHSGDVPPLWSREPIMGLGDLAGRRLSAPGLGADVARGLGAEVHPALAPHAAAAALRDGSVDAVEAGDLTNSLAAGFADAARYATGQGLNSRGTAYALSVRASIWDRLPDADKAILAAAAAEEYQLTLAAARAHAGLARQVLEARGVVFAPWPADIAEALERVAEATIAHVAARDATAARINQSYMAFRGLISGSLASAAV